jgi:hypothetical protein
LFGSVRDNFRKNPLFVRWFSLQELRSTLNAPEAGASVILLRLATDGHA